MTSLQRGNRQSWFLAGVAAIAIIALIGVLFAVLHTIATSNRVSRDEQTRAARDACYQRWADATADRSAFIQRFLTPRNNAQNAFEVAVAEGKPRSEINRLRLVFIAASTVYARESQAHPLPLPPRLACGAIPATSPSGTPTSLPSTSPSSSRGVTTPRTQAATQTPRPTRTPTRVGRGPTSTEPSPTVTRTATVTPTPRPSPSGSSGLINRVLCPILTLPSVCKEN